MYQPKKVGIGILTLLSAFLVSCTPTGIDLKLVWQKILWVGTLGFLGYSDNPMGGFMRIMVAILVFAILFELATLTRFIGRNTAVIIAAILAIISAMFIPRSVLAGIGAAYGTIVALVLIGVPVLGGLYAFSRIPTTTRWHRFMRLVIILIVLAVLIQIRGHALDLTGIGITHKLVPI